MTCSTEEGSRGSNFIVKKKLEMGFPVSGSINAACGGFENLTISKISACSTLSTNISISGRSRETSNVDPSLDCVIKCPQETEIGFTVSRALMRKMEKLQNPMGLRVRTQTYAGLFEELVNMGLKKPDLNQKTDIRLKKEDSLPPVEVVSPAGLF
jgi:hypothetical protein